MPDAIPHKFLCECGQVLINHYPSQRLIIFFNNKCPYRILKTKI